MTERRLRKMVRGWKGVREYIPYGPTQLQQMVKEGRLAPPTKLGPRAIAWFEDDLIAAQEALANYVPPPAKTKIKALIKRVAGDQRR